MRVVMEVSDRVTVLDHGEKIAGGLAARKSRRARGSSRRTSGRRGAAPRGRTMLKVESLARRLRRDPGASTGVALEVGRGEIVTILGNNGAGKTTTLKTISGLLRPTARRRSTLEGEPLVGVPPHAIVARGVAHVPEGRRIFNRLTVRENLDDGRLSPDATRDRRRPRARLRALPAPRRSASRRWPARSRAASSRCSPSAARSWRTRGSSCWTSRAWGWRRSW